MGLTCHDNAANSWYTRCSDHWVVHAVEGKSCKKPHEAGPLERRTLLHVIRTEPKIELAMEVSKMIVSSPSHYMLLRFM